VLTRLTTWGAIIFMVTSLSLTVLYARGTHSHSVLGDQPTRQTTPAKK
jgi:preprotein translocase subunit SecG